MQSTSALIVAGLGASLILGAAPRAQAKQTPDEVTQREIQALREQVEALQRRLDAQSAAQQQTKAEAAAAAAKAAAAPAHADAAAAAVPAQVQTQVQSAVEAAKPKTDKIYFRGVTITPGGFLEAASVYRSRNTNNDITTSFGSIP